jgi:glutamine amidotransferase
MSAIDSGTAGSTPSDSSPEVVIADCGIGNLGSVANMVRHVGGHAFISQDPAVVTDAPRVILPGVGNFKFGMRRLNELGMSDALNAARSGGSKILGICLGMALMTGWSDEGMCEGLGWFEFKTVKFPTKTSTGDRLPVPHMGWNQVLVEGSNPSFESVPMPARFYFVHSYYVDGAGRPRCVATTEYGGVRFASAIGDDNVMGVQFHPEKSHKYGMAFIRKFVMH